MTDVKFWKDDDYEYMSYYDKDGEYHISILKAYFDDDWFDD